MRGEIVFLVTSAHLGGAERSVLDVLATFPEEARVVLLSTGPLQERIAPTHAVDVVPMPASVAGHGLPRTLPLAWLRDVRRALEGARVVHTTGNKAHVLATWLAPRGARVVWHLRDAVSDRRVLRTLLGARRACGAIAISEWLARDVRQALPGLRVVVVPNAIDTQAFSPRPVTPSFTAGLVATFATWKGHEVFLEAASLAASELPGARFAVIGGPIYAPAGSQVALDALQRRASPAVTFLPFQEDAAGAFASLEIAVHASTRPEPFGRTVVEAMSCGRPVIASAEGGPLEIVTSGTGVLVPPRDPRALAAAIVSLAKDPARRAALGEAARRRAVLHFSRERLGPQVLEAIRELADLAPRSQRTSPRIAVLADFLEEGWPSMDKVASELAKHLPAELVRPRFQPLPGRTLARGWNRFVTASRLIPKIEPSFDFLHVSDHSYAHVILAATKPAGVFCHDLDAFRGLPELGLSPSESRPAWLRALARRTFRGLQAARVVFVSTEVLRREVSRWCPRVVVAPYGVSSLFSSGRETRDDFVLHVGSCIPRKRIDVLLRVAARLGRKLIQIGGDFTREQRLIIDELRIDVEQRRGLSEEELAALYRKAALVLLPSEREGFGLPIVEALACGAPVVASDLPELREVGGDAVAFAPVANVDAWVDAARSVLEGRGPSLEARLARAARFSWPEHARIIRDSYLAL